MLIFNSYVVFDKEGSLIAHARSLSGDNSNPEKYFEGLSRGTQCQAHILIVVQEGGYVARYRVTQPSIPAPTLGPRESFI